MHLPHRQSERNDFRGAPSDPMSAEELDARFLSLTGSIGDRASALLGELRRLDEITDVRALSQLPDRDPRALAGRWLDAHAQRRRSE